MYPGIILAVKSCNDEEQEKTNPNEEATATVIS